MTAEVVPYLRRNPPDRILVIPLRYIGDTVLTVPLIRNLAREFPNACLDVLASATTASLLEPSPYINRVLIEPKGARARLSLLKQGGYDVVFNLRKSVTMALLCRLAGIPTVVGYDKQRFPWGYRRWGWFLTDRARYPTLKTVIPQAVSHLSLMSVCGLSATNTYLELWTRPEDEHRIEALLPEPPGSPAPLSVIHLASASHGKTVDPVRFVESMRLLHQAGYVVATIGLATDAPLYEDLAAQAEVSIVNLAGQTSLRETYAVLKRARLLLTLDSGPIHLGAAADVPHIVGVFGPTNEKQWGPHHPAGAFYPVFVDLPCRPCYAKVCSHNNCKVTLPADRITDAVRTAIASARAQETQVASS